MANALNPNTALDEFKRQSADSLARFDQLFALAQGDAALSLRRALATDATFRLGAFWEIFQHRWHVAAISRRPEVFRRRIQEELDTALKKGATAGILKALSPAALEIPRRLKAAQIEALLDPDGYNLSFRTCEVWARRAAEDLDPVHADLERAVAGDQADSSVIALLKALRNAIAHSSTGSMQALNNAARVRPHDGSEGLVGPANSALARDRNRIADIGTYLAAWVPARQTRRVHLLHSRTLDVAERLRT